jgi:pyrimidine deaminase RibD-like protein
VQLPLHANDDATNEAWIEAAGGLVVTANRGPGAMPWDSAVTRLIHGVSAEFGEERYRILRRPLNVCGHLSEWDRNLVKVCAKRISRQEKKSAWPRGARVIDTGRDLLPDVESVRCPELRDTFASCAEIRELITALASNERQKWLGKPLHLSPRCVVAALTGPDGKILGVHANTNTSIQMRHAELNLFLAMHAAGMHKIPEGSTLYVTLKPCRMCASLILALQAKPSPLKVIALEDDPGPHGKHQLLPGLQLSPQIISK